jgi:signal transduction histidine kinase
MGAAGEINQVLLNLLDNALRAHARTVHVAVHDEPGWIVVSVADDGDGIPAEIAERVFDPFFTTRAPGDGTGLGLYLSRQIVEESGGTLSLIRRVGGTEFELRLPDADSTALSRGQEPGTDGAAPSADTAASVGSPTTTADAPSPARAHRAP